MGVDDLFMCGCSGMQSVETVRSCNAVNGFLSRTSGTVRALSDVMQRIDSNGHCVVDALGFVCSICISRHYCQKFE